MDIKITVREDYLRAGQRLYNLSSALVMADIKGLTTLDNIEHTLTILPDNYKQAQKAIIIIKKFVNKTLI